MMHFKRKLLAWDLLLLLLSFSLFFLLAEKNRLSIGFLIFILYAALKLAILHRLIRPIQQIIDVVLPYRDGGTDSLPRVVLSPVGKNDEFSKLAFTLNSLTERLKAENANLLHQKRETEGILESLAEGIIAFDPAGLVTFANHVACRMLEVSHVELLDHTLEQAREDVLLKKCHELILHVLQTSETTVEKWTLGQANSIHFDLIAAPLADQSGAILVLQDKTSDYKIVEMGKHFIANASHELRTPITIIRGFAETLQDLPHVSRDMLREITEKILRTCGRLEKLVKGLLTMADIESFSEERFLLCDLIALAENCKHLLLTAYPNVSITLKTELFQAPVKAEGDLLDLAIMNLLENAVKYSVTPAHIQMVIAKKEDEIVLEVHDKGIGIPPADLPYVFDRFYTVDKARSRKLGGAGLGLSIVKTVMDKHRGKAEVASELGEGSLFALRLPLKAWGKTED